MLAAATLLAGCEEFQPVINQGRYPVPALEKIYTDDDFEKFTPISEVKQMYVDNGSKPYDITKHCVIKGQIITSIRVSISRMLPAVSRSRSERMASITTIR